MGFRSPGHGLLAGYQSGLAHNLQRDNLDLQERQLGLQEEAARAAQQRAGADASAAAAKAEEDRRKALMGDVETLMDYLRQDTPDSRALSASYARQAERFWGSEWPEELRSQRLLPQAPVASPGVAGAPPRPQSQPGQPSRTPSLFAGAFGGFHPATVQTGWRGAIPTGAAPAAQLPAGAAGTGPAAVPTPSALMTPLAMRGYGSAKLAAEDAKAAQDMATIEVGQELGSDLITYIATGGYQHEPQMGLVNAVLNDPQSLAPLLMGHAANATAAGADPTVVGQEVGRIWSMAMDLDRISSATTSRSYEALRLQFQQNDQLRGYLSDVERAAVTRFGGRITGAGIDFSMLAEGERPAALFFIQNSLAKVMGGMTSTEAILRTTEEMGQIDFTPKSLAEATQGINDTTPRPMIKTINAPSVLPGTNLEPAEAAEFPWDDMFPGSQHQFDPVAGVYVLYLPMANGDWQASAVAPQDIVEFVRTTRGAGINPSLGQTPQGFQWSLDARRRGEQKLMGRTGGR